VGQSQHRVCVRERVCECVRVCVCVCVCVCHFAQRSGLVHVARAVRIWSINNEHPAVTTSSLHWYGLMPQPKGRPDKVLGSKSLVRCGMGINIRNIATG